MRSLWTYLRTRDEHICALSVHFCAVEDVPHYPIDADSCIEIGGRFYRWCSFIISNISPLFKDVDYLCTLGIICINISKYSLYTQYQLSHISRIYDHNPIDTILRSI